MTISAACVCAGETQQIILAVSDRMITSGDIEFEAEQSKITPLAPRIVCLFAGHRDFHNMIASAARRTVAADGVTAVADAAEIYASNFVMLRRRRAELKYLAPLGLTWDTFLSRQRELNPDQASSLTSRLFDETLGVQAIIAGTDATGPHIWSVALEGGEIGQAICHDGRAFVAIGAGQRQFETQFMSLGYTAEWGSLHALLLMFSAKKRAEVSPGVGAATDVVWVKDAVYPFMGEHLEKLGHYSREFERAVAKARKEIIARMAADPLFVNRDDAESPPALPPPGEPANGSG